jgi:hypothetical protein
MIGLTIHVGVDDMADAMALQSIVLDRYLHASFSFDMSNHVEEADDDDVDPMSVLELLAGVRERLSSDESRVTFDRMLNAMGIPQPGMLDGDVHAAIDRAHRVPPSSERVKADDRGPGARAIKMQVIDAVLCPYCKTNAGTPCKSPSGHDYGIGFAHQARIDRWYDQ